MRQRRDSRNAIIVVLCFVVIGMGVGFAALSQNINVTGNTQIKGATWDVHITSITACTSEMAQTDAKCLAPVGNAKDVVADTKVLADPTKAQFTTTMVAPSDKITYKVVINNAGSLDAKVSGTPAFQKTAEQTIPLTYSFTGVEEGTQIAKTSGTNTVYITVEYTGSAVTATDTTVTNIFDVNYIQDMAA